MEYRIIEKNIPSSDGVHTLKGLMYIPEGEIKAVLHVVHGMCEHIGRYDPFMKFMAEKGYLVCGYNHVGHKDTSPKEEYGFINETDGAAVLVDDVVLFADEIKKEYQDKKYILMGHSMGSFVVRLAAVKLGRRIDALIVMGTGGPNPAAGMGISIAKSKVRRGRGRKVSKMIYLMAFGKYNSRTDKETMSDWLTHDKDIIKEHLKDEDCQFRFTSSAMRDLITMNRDSNRKECLQAYDSNLPILLISGDEDPVGDYGKGVRKVYMTLLSLGKNVTLKMYPGMRHEVLNEIGKEDVREYLFDWCEKNLGV